MWRLLGQAKIAGVTVPVKSCVVGGVLGFVFSNSQQWHSPTMLDAVLAQWARAMFLNVMKSQASDYSLNKPDHIRIQSYVHKQCITMWLTELVELCHGLPRIWWPKLSCRQASGWQSSHDNDCRLDLGAVLLSPSCSKWKQLEDGKKK